MVLFSIVLFLRAERPRGNKAADLLQNPATANAELGAVAPETNV